MSRKLPPLNPLRVFQTVARVGNLTTAAQELHVSQSAVSRQVATLENYLGVELLRREARGVSLTRIGANYAALVTPAFDQIAKATESLLDTAAPGALRVRTYTTFTAKWLIPRLPAFNTKHPDIDIIVKNGVPDVDFEKDGVDIAIQFGDGAWTGVSADLLFHDVIEPVCSPEFLKKKLAPGEHPGKLLQTRLLVSRYRKNDWNDWLEATGNTLGAAGAETMRFSTSVLTWQAALDGLGIAIGQTPLLQNELDRGALVRPFSQPVQNGKGYYLVRPKVRHDTRKTDVFRTWLLETIRPKTTTNPA